MKIRIRWVAQTARTKKKAISLLGVMAIHSVCSAFFFMILPQGEVIAQSIQWPDRFPINMGFKTLLSATNQPNHYFDTLENAGRYAIHHSGMNPANLIKSTYGDQLISIVMNPGSVDGENRNNGVNHSQTHKVWPGFWLQYAGSKITANVTTGAAGITVEDPYRFATNDWVIIYSLDGNGKPSWFFLPSGVPSGQSTGYYADTFLPMFEYAQVTGINYSTKIVTLSRGKTGTEPKSYTANQAAAASMIPAWAVEEDEGSGKVITQFNINRSLNAPKHPGTGENAAAFWARGIVSAMNAGINDGSESDVQHCLINGKADVDCDLVADGGFKDSVNMYALGYQEYTKAYRQGVGSSKIIQLDSIRPRNGYRGFKYVNGVQMETFMKGDVFSQAFDMLEQWVQKAESQPRFSYGYCRAATQTYGGVAGGDAMFRKQFAVGLLLGMPHPYGNGDNFGLFDWDEQRGGNLDDYTWLGKAIGPYQRVTSAMGTTDLIAGKNWTVQVDQGFAAASSGSVTDSAGLQVNATQVPAGERNYYGVRVKYNETQMQLTTGAVYTLVFDAKATDVVTYNGVQYGGMPGFIEIKEHGTIQKIGVLATSGWRTYRMSFTTGVNGKFRTEFGLGEGKCTFWIKNIRLYTGSPDRLWRDFENGRVYLNESQEPWSVDLGTNVYWRLKGDINPQLHNGSMVTGVVTVPVKDALYLLKHRPRFMEEFNYSAGQGLTTVSGDWQLLRNSDWIVKNDTTNHLGQVDISVAPPTGIALAAVHTNKMTMLTGQFLQLTSEYTMTGSGQTHGIAFGIQDGWNHYGVIVHANDKMFRIVKVTSGTVTVLASTAVTSALGNGVLNVEYNSATGKIKAGGIIGGQTYVLDVVDTEYRAGRVGIYAAAGSAFRVRNFDAVVRCKE
jgi:hypothetical protein